MIDQNLIPVLDPNPLPAPYWVFKLLLIVTFVLHIVAMNLVLGGGVLALTARLFAGRSGYARRVYQEISTKLPALLPATITLGVAPLLFVQVIYGQFFYTSSVIVAWPWFSVLVLLTLAYYGFYFVSYRARRESKATGWVLMPSVVFVTAIGFVYTNNFTLSSTPDRWVKYFAAPSGWSLNLSEKTLVPRFLHFFAAAVAVAGMFVALIGLAKWRKEGEYARYLVQFGGKAFLYATMAQFVLGAWFLMSLPRERFMVFMGESVLASSLFILGLAGALAAIVILSGSLRGSDPRRGILWSAAITVVVIASMAVMRDLLRDAYLGRNFQPGQMVVKTQWQVLPLFLVLFISGALLWLVMMKRYGFLRETAAEDPAVRTASGTGPFDSGRHGR